MKCCANCIDDQHLRKDVIPSLSTTIGACSYCTSENQALVEPMALREHFELLSSIYASNANGKTLVELFREDWAMFGHEDAGAADAGTLLSAILDDDAIVQQRFVPSDLCHSDTLVSWENLRRELMYANRFFPRTDLNLDRLKELLPYLLLDSADLPNVWYRARIQKEETPYSVEEMSAPPKSKASHGRANPAGIPYLYLASDVPTAIAEIRPHAGEDVNVANFSVGEDLKVVDLRGPRKTVSPFMLADENEVALLRGDIEFLEHLGEELTRPVFPRAAATDYVPSQYLCEFVKNCGFHGVMYRSSAGEGVNVALFDPDLATGRDVTQHKVSSVSIETE